MHGADFDSVRKKWHGTLQSYLIGFFLSAILTAMAFWFVMARIFDPLTLIATIIALAVMQAAAQLLFFLHVGQETKPKWETLVFSFMALVLVIIVLGSLWIMFDLHHRVMPGMKGG